MKAHDLIMTIDEMQKSLTYVILQEGEVDFTVKVK